jgi:hypothetical protein
MPQFAPRPGLAAQDVAFDLGYAAKAVEACPHAGGCATRASSVPVCASRSACPRRSSERGGRGILLEKATPALPGVGEPEVIAQLNGSAAWCPGGIQLGYDLCYGDYPETPGEVGGHFKQPKDASLLVHLVNGIVCGARRPVD